jgi:hypothetical protein
MTWDVFTYGVEIAGRRHDVVSPIDCLAEPAQPIALR